MGFGWAPIVAAVIALAAACYQPAVSPGAPCGPAGACPSGLECRGDVCVVPGAPLADAGNTGDGDALPLLMDAAPDAGPGYVPWGAPVLLSTGVPSETDPSMTLDRLTIVFMSETTEDLYIATRATPTGALTVTALTAVNTMADEKSPEISPDGRTLYFTSNRGGNYDVYRSTLTTVWSAPTVMTDLSTAGDDGDVAISPDGLTAVVVKDEATNRLFVHTRATTSQAFGSGVHHPELSVSPEAAAPTITNGGDVIYFQAGAVRDLYVAARKIDGNYTTPVPVTELNTAIREAAPFVLQDNKHMIFDRANDLYEASRP